jgi:hypothetical protein
MQRTLFTLCGALLASAPLHADVVTITPTKDATIFNDGNGSHADGMQSTMYAGRAGTNTTYPVRRALVAFDVAGAVPAGSTITSVQVRLYMSQTTVGSFNFTLNRLTTNWNEGPTVGQSGGGGNSQVGDTTWLHTFWNNQFWTTAGGDFAAAASATASIGNAVQYYTWNSTAALVADVQGWLDTPAANFGWIVRGPEGGLKTAKQFESRQSLAQFRPQLVINYTPPGPTVYCTAKTNSLGCVPAIGFSGTPDANAGSGFAITSSNTLNQKSGLLFYSGNGAASASFQGGTMCVQAPVLRTPVQNSGGTVGSDDCSGVFSLDFNVRIASGVDPQLVAGVTIWSQYWSRDPAASFTTNLSNGLRFTIQP